MSALPKQYFETYLDMLADLGKWSGRPIMGKLCAFWPMRGLRYKKGRDILLLGRAVNGWEADPKHLFENLDLGAPGRRRTVAERARQASDWHSGLDWPMQPTADYNPNRSDFWMAAREIVCRHFGGAEDTWSEQVAWSNLYKVAPAVGGNPGVTLQRAQRDACRRLLRLEVEALQPRLIVFFTGWDWAEDLVPEELEWVRPERTDYVERVGSSGERRWVIVCHPQARPRAAFVQEIIDAVDA